MFGKNMEPCVSVFCLIIHCWKIHELDVIRRQKPGLRILHERRNTLQIWWKQSWKHTHEQWSQNWTGSDWRPKSEPNDHWCNNEFSPNPHESIWLPCSMQKPHMSSKHHGMKPHNKRMLHTQVCWTTWHLCIPNQLKKKLTNGSPPWHMQCGDSLSKHGKQETNSHTTKIPTSRKQCNTKLPWKRPNFHILNEKRIHLIV